VSLARTVIASALLVLSGCAGCESAPSAPPGEGAAPAVDAAPPAAQLPVAPAAEEPDCLVIVDADPDYGEPPLTVQFETEVECTGSPVTYEWDFGDGEKGSGEARPRHVYAKAGDYVAVVRVTAPDGGRSDDEIDIAVEALFAD